MDPQETALIAEQLTHALDIIRSEIASLRADLEHYEQLTDNRLKYLEKCGDDHEDRIRSATEGVTQFKVWSGLSSGAASLLSIMTFIKVTLGGG